jgi:hypothetical protein
VDLNEPLNNQHKASNQIDIVVKMTGKGMQNANTQHAAAGATSPHDLLCIWQK